ncbi:MAG: TIGR01777 family oxidoreductase [Elusimicrobiota bacterium]|nr:TIGR01777 family oxidoreductase [Elusimicrobiota bacterium]
MSVRTLRRTQWLPHPRPEVFAFFQDPANLAKLTPPWLGFHVLTPGPLEMRAGAVFDYRVSPLGFPQYWRTLIESYDAPDGFVDTQLKGPYKLWHHTHRFEDKDGGTLITDEVRYELPLQPFGELAAGEIERRLDAIFAYRESAVAALFKPKGGSMKIVIAGGNGWIGRDLSRALINAGHDVVVLSRSGEASRIPGVRTRSWLVADAGGWESELDGADAVVNLCGEGVADGPWTAARRGRLLHSRLTPTRALVSALGRAEKKPPVLINASAVGWYAQDGERVQDEADGAGPGFLSDLCVRWEKEAREAEKLGTRVVLLRIGVVLGRDGGALSRMLLPFKLALGGRLGDGRQHFPWVHLDDVTGLIISAITNERLRGPVNAVGPELATNAEFTAALGKVLSRPTPFPVPAVVLRLALGEMSSLLLGSLKIAPTAAMDAGYRFKHPRVEDALAAAVRSRSIER